MIRGGFNKGTVYKVWGGHKEDCYDAQGGRNSRRHSRDVTAEEEATEPRKGGFWEPGNLLSKDISNLRQSGREGAGGIEIITAFRPRFLCSLFSCCSQELEDKGAKL